jgi:hypothetical protein
MVRWYALAVVAIAGVIVAAKAQVPAPPGIVFDGTARVGSDTRPVRFRFFCSSNSGPNVTGVLAVELEIPQYDQLSSVFDFEPFEGPDANAGPLTLLRTSGAHGTASGRFTVSGSIIPSGASEAFMLGIDASRRDAVPLRNLAAILRPLTGSPAQLIWEQGNASPGGKPMTATLVLNEARSAQLKTGIGPCLGAR